MRTIRFLSLNVGMALLAGLTLAQAQPDPNYPPPQRRPDRPPGQELPDRPMRPAPGAIQAAPMLERIAGLLTEEQRLSTVDFMPEMREKVRELEPKIQEARRALLDESLAEEFRETSVRRRANALATLEAERAVIMAKALSLIEPPLTADQRQQIKRIIAAEMRQGQGGPQPQQQLRRPRPNVPRDENDLPPRDLPPRDLAPQHTPPPRDAQ